MTLIYLERCLENNGFLIVDYASIGLNSAQCLSITSFSEISVTQVMYTKVLLVAVTPQGTRLGSSIEEWERSYYIVI